MLLALLLFLILFFLKVPTRTHLKRDRGSLLSSVLLPAITKCPGGGWGYSMDFWIEVCRQGLQTPILFMTKIVHFTTLLKTREALNSPNSFVSPLLLLLLLLLLL